MAGNAPLSKLNLSPRIIQWFKEEMHLQPGQGIKFFGKVYGETNAHTGFSAGMARCDHPNKPVIDTEVDGLHFYVQAADYWFFEGLDAQIDYDEGIDGPSYYFTPNDGSKLDTVASASVKNQHTDCNYN